jgi:hypothetical protein
LVIYLPASLTFRTVFFILSCLTRTSLATLTGYFAQNPNGICQAGMQLCCDTQASTRDPRGHSTMLSF